MAILESEKFVRYSAEVDDINEAWSFVMDHIDRLNEPDVEIHICHEHLGEDEVRKFYSCTVYGVEL